MNRHACLLLALAAFNAGAAAQTPAQDQPPAQPQTTSPPTTPGAQPLIENIMSAAQALAAIAPAPTPTIILDVRKPEAFAEGHLTGAINIPFTRWAAIGHATSNAIDDAEAWRTELATAGIGNTSRVLIYDEGKLTTAAGAWFILQKLGIKRVGIVNGGFPALKAANATITTDPTPASTATPPEWKPPTAPTAVDLADKDEVKGLVTSGTRKILDARTPAEYQGTDARGNPRTGHIPGAISLPHTDLLDKDGLLLPATELRKKFEEAGFKRGDPITAHCQSGARSSLVALALVQAGYGDVQNYFGSFGEWSKDATCELVK